MSAERTQTVIEIQTFPNFGYQYNSDRKPNSNGNLPIADCLTMYQCVLISVSRNQTLHGVVLCVLRNTETWSNELQCCSGAPGII